jgi:septal ring factor EnvC (AmiA/AmiB activator)
VISDTPISDSTPHNVAELGMLCRKLERELNAANERIKNLESALCTVENIDKVNAYQDLESANQRIKRLEECTQISWGIIANVDSGSWGEQRSDWREAAIRWRDEQFHPAFRLSEHQAKEAKP